MCCIVLNSFYICDVKENKRKRSSWQMVRNFVSTTPISFKNDHKSIAMNF